MAAYAALLSLARSLNLILDLEKHIDPLHKKKIVSLHKKVDEIVTLLEDYSDNHGGTLDLMGNGFREAAYEAQDFMDSYLCSVSTTYNDDWSSSEANWDKKPLDQDLNMALERINFIWEESMKMKNNDTTEDLRPVTYSSPVDQSSGVKIMAKSMDVGFDDDLNAIKERLYEDSDKLQIIPIVGMGGIGKTTLARKAYNDSLLTQHFDICAWITISAEYQRRDILLELLQYFKKPDDEQFDTENSSGYVHSFKKPDEQFDHESQSTENSSGYVPSFKKPDEQFDHESQSTENFSESQSTENSSGYVRSFKTPDEQFDHESQSIENSSGYVRSFKKPDEQFDHESQSTENSFDHESQSTENSSGYVHSFKTPDEQFDHESQSTENSSGYVHSFKTPDEQFGHESQSTENSSGYVHSFKKPDDELYDKNDAELEKLVYQNLIGRRYLIVIDDIWSTKAWDDLKKVFRDDEIGSRILLTTRISDVAIHAGSSGNPLHKMNFLSEDYSWKLLQERIFGQEPCPLQLVEIGKKIARNCGGLPLTIVVVAGLLLSSGNVTNQELWENISEHISSTDPKITLQCSKILCLSYDRLPLRLKPCFLYITAFPEDVDISVSKLIKLWVAEGFVRQNDEPKCLEDVGEGILEDLVNRNLILVNKKGLDGKAETIGIHDLLRDICITKAEEEGFLHHVSSKRAAQNEAVESPSRRISIHFARTFQEWPIKDSRVHSLLFFSERGLGSRLSLGCRRLSILDAPEVTWPNFSDVISAFVNLRYISFALNSTSCPHGFPTSISKLPNLETLIAHISPNMESFEVPYEIWKKPKLRHLIMNAPFCLSYPSDVGIIHESGLQTLDAVNNFRFTEEAVKILVNLKKLIVFLAMFYDNWDDFNLDNFFRLQNLEELQLSVHNLYNPSGIWDHYFPISLKKLTLCGVPLPWKNMTIIGSLPNLEVLQMMSIDVTEASEWTPVEGPFLRLKHFSSSLDNLVKWEVEKENFPILETLILKYVWLIDEIPDGIGEIDSLQLIELVDCHPSLVVSAEQIQKRQYDNGNDTFQVCVRLNFDWGRLGRT